MIAIGVEPEYRSAVRSLSGWGPKEESDAPIAVESEIMNFFRPLKWIWRSDSFMIAIMVELEYRSVIRSISGWGPKGESNAPITAESEVADSFILLKLIRQSDSSMIAIRVEPKHRSVARSLFGWGPKGELKAPIAAGSEVMDFLRRRCACICSSDLL
jgi:hypothetical protein